MSTIQILSCVDSERQRQNRLVADGTLPYNCSAISVDHALKLPILMEEAGEVAVEVYDYGAAKTPAAAALAQAKLKTELIQLAAVAVAWAESIDV